MRGNEVGDVEMELPVNDLLRLYYFLQVTRALDDQLQQLRLQGQPGVGISSGRGQEATAVGAAYALEPGDIVAPLHRDLGAMLVRGLTPREIVAHVLLRDAPLARGRDGHLHLGDMRDRLIIPATGILGQTLPVAAGTALAARLRGEQRVTLAFIGDGALALGEAHEALTLAAAQDLPLVCVVENNGYALSQPTSRQHRARHLADRAPAYGMTGTVVDGNDIIAVHDATRRAVASARAGLGPALIEATTLHVPRDDTQAPAYIPRDVLAHWRRMDPLDRYTRYLRMLGVLDDAKADDYQSEIASLIADAVAYALALPAPEPGMDPTGLFAPEDALPMGPPLIAVGAMTRERIAITA